MWFLRTWEIVVAIEGGLAIEMVMVGMTVGDSGRSLFGQVMKPPRANQRAKKCHIRRPDLLSSPRAVPSPTISTNYRLTTTAFRLATSNLEGSICHQLKGSVD